MLEKEVGEAKESLAKVDGDLEVSKRLLAELSEASSAKVASLEADLAKVKAELESSKASIKQQV